MRVFKICEVVDSNGELIGANDIPQNGADLETAANGTTDMNAKIGTQPMRWNTMSMFGFNMLPFYEGKEGEGVGSEIIEDLSKFFYDYYLGTLEYYYKNPNKLKSDFRKKSEKTFDEIDDKEDFKNISNSVLKVIEPYLKKSVNSIDESYVSEDSIIEKKETDEFNEKDDDKELSAKKIGVIADLLNKLDKKDLKKIVDLIEVSNGK